MSQFELKNVDPRAVARAAEHLGQRPSAVAEQAMHVGPSFIPGRGPVSMPVAMPGPPGGGGYNRYREMTLEEMLLENRVIFLVGEINHVIRRPRLHADALSAIAEKGSGHQPVHQQRPAEWWMTRWRSTT